MSYLLETLFLLIEKQYAKGQSNDQSMFTSKPVENDLKHFIEGLKTLGRPENDVIIVGGEKGKQGGLLLPRLFILIDPVQTFQFL